MHAKGNKEVTVMLQLVEYCRAKGQVVTSDKNKENSFKSL